MKNVFSMLLFAAILFLAPAALAQRGGHSGHSGHSGGHQGQSQGSGSHNGSQGYQGGNKGHDRDRFDVRGGRLRHDIEAGRFGRDHRYYGRDFHWYGRPYFVGSRFFIGGWWFEVYGPWPVGWDDSCGYYVDYDVASGGYFLYCPDYPGVSVSVGVMF